MGSRVPEDNRWTFQDRYYLPTPQTHDTQLVAWWNEMTHSPQRELFKCWCLGAITIAFRFLWSKLSSKLCAQFMKTKEQTKWPQCGMIELLWYNACIRKLFWLGGRVTSWEQIHLTGIPWRCWKHFVCFFFYHFPQGVEFVMSHLYTGLKDQNSASSSGLGAHKQLLILDLLLPWKFLPTEMLH